MRRLWFLALLGIVAVVATIGVACTRESGHDDHAAATREHAATADHATTRDLAQPTSDAARIATHNTRRIDYIGPDACGGCHPDEHARWSQSLHRVMNARADDAGAVIGDFSGATVAFDGGEAKFTREGAAYVMTFARGDQHVRYRVTRTIGHRGLQEYVGIEDGPPEIRRAATEVRLPFGWWPRYGGWAPQIAFDPWLETLDPYTPVREPWAERCPWCHSTYPFDQRIARAEALGVGHGLEQLVATGSGAPAAPRGRDRLDVDAQVTTGISCESCHLGGRAHADGAAIQFLPHGAATAGLPRTFAEQRQSAAVVNGVCAQCHSGPSPRLSDGTALRNSSEAIDLAASPCTGIKCTDCHDPHRADSRAPDVEARSIATCTRCHDELADAAAAKAHAGAGHTQATCLDCHMPKIVLGIDRFVRTHRISSPTNLALYAEGAPNACNLCHLDHSTRWTLDALQLHVPKPVIDLDQPLGELWLGSTSPALRVLATWAYATSPLARYVDLKKGLTDPVPYVRAWTQMVLKQAPVSGSR